MNFKKWLAGCALGLGAMTADAGQLAGKNIIMIQGFQPQHVFLGSPHDGGKRFGYHYWNRFGLYNDGNGTIDVVPQQHDNDVALLLHQVLPTLRNGNDTFNIYDRGYEADFKTDEAARILYYDSSLRLFNDDPNSNKPTIGAQITEQLNEIFAENSNFCTDTQGCIVITHSTGDLVMQWMEDNKSALSPQARAGFQVTTYLDLAGARGGTEGADELMVVADFLKEVFSKDELTQSEQDRVDDANELLNTMFGTRDVYYFNPGMTFNSGVLFNLQPGQARQVGLGNPDDIPHLRVASAGDELYAPIAHVLIRGHDDSVVPLHSACGASIPLTINTCERGITLNGKRSWFTDGPRSSQYYTHHHTFIQSNNLRHNGHQWDDTGNVMVPLASNSESYGDVDVDIEWYTYRKWFDTYDTILFSKYKTLAEVLDDSLE